jgi:broad specificity phosphatase PhoE
LGELERYSAEERARIFAESMARHEREGMFWRPEKGERMLDVATRLFWVLDTLHRERSEDDVVIVCHGEVIQVFRLLIERVPPEEYPAWYASDNSGDWKLPNGGIVQYTRTNPDTGKESPFIEWVRIIAPNDHDPKEPEWSAWRTITRKKYSSDELLRVAKKFPDRLVN